MAIFGRQTINPVSFGQDTPAQRIPITDPRSYASLNTYRTPPNELSPDGLWLGYQSNRTPHWAMSSDQILQQNQGFGGAFDPRVVAGLTLGGGLLGGFGGAGGAAGGAAGAAGSLPALPGSIGGSVASGLAPAAGAGAGAAGSTGVASGLGAAGLGTKALTNVAKPAAGLAGGTLSGIGNFLGSNAFTNSLTGLGLLGSIFGGGKKNINETTTSEPPEYLQGPLRDAVAAALGQFGGGGQDIYPFLDSAFQRASDLTKTRLDTEFAGAGRNLGASYPARSDELQTLAASIYSPNNLYQFDPTQQLIDRLTQLLPGSGGTTTSRYPVFKTGLF